MAKRSDNMGVERNLVEDKHPGMEQVLAFLKKSKAENK
jgi:hypothetical protein